MRSSSVSFGELVGRNGHQQMPVSVSDGDRVDFPASPGKRDSAAGDHVLAVGPLRVGGDLV
jgi:hypothetical protein